MKPSKVRLKRRATQQRLHGAGATLEEAAREFVSWNKDGNTVVGRAKARHALYQAAISFAAEVDGEEPTQPMAALKSVASK